MTSPPAPVPLSPEEVNRFAYHPPRDAAATAAHEVIRTISLGFADVLACHVPAGRHRSLALTAVQEAMMWANAGIAIDLNPPTEDAP